LIPQRSWNRILDATLEGTDTGVWEIEVWMNQGETKDKDRVSIRMPGEGGGVEILYRGGRFSTSRDREGRRVRTLGETLNLLRNWYA
jgi:hypothetical protein